MHANLIKFQVENCPALPGRNLISTCGVKSVSAGRVKISSRQAGIMYNWIILDPFRNIHEIYANLAVE